MLSGILTVVAVILMVAFTIGTVMYVRNSRQASTRVSPDTLGHAIHLTDPDHRAEWLASCKAGATTKEQLRTLDALRAEGLISQEEWEATRTDILKNL
jgi:hypothetical protein